MICYVMMRTELFIKYFCNISCVVYGDLMTKCLLFTEKLFVFKHCFIFIVLGWDTSTPGSMEGPQRCDRGVAEGRDLTDYSGQTGI